VAAGAAQHDHAQVGLGREVVHGCADLGHHPLVQGVANLRAIQGQTGDARRRLDADVLEGRLAHG